MRDHARLFWVLAALAVVLEIGSLSSPLNAQQTPEGSQAQQPSQQPPNRPARPRLRNQRHPPSPDRRREPSRDRRRERRPLREPS